MEYQVSARKWRPQKFSELVGQEHIVRTLANAIKNDRVSHAYLFSGTRGVGKTTSARLFAKALNCETGPTPEPCDECGFCVEIREGRCLDVQEIDGASNTGVGEIREIIDNVRYSAAACNYKVYIIDEVHMLSKSAFNALLKTLEEPPAHVVFIFATTEQRKIPETILSRCQCFEFKPLSQAQIVLQMETICKHESIKIDPASLEEVAKTGAGSMRDAQSLLDQVIAFSGREVSHGAVESVLGIVGQDKLENFMNLLIEKDNAGLLALVQEVINQGKDLHFFCRDLIEYIRNLLVVAVTKQPETLINTHTCNLDALKQQAKAFHADQLQQMFQVLLNAETEMKRTVHPQMIFEMAVIRLSDIRPFRDLGELIRKVDRMATQSAPSGRVESPAKKKVTPEQTTHVNENVPEATPSINENHVPDIPTDEARQATPTSDWENVRREVCSRHQKFLGYLDKCRLKGLDQNTLHLEFAESFALDLLKREDNQKILKKIVQDVTGNNVSIKLTLGNAEAIASQKKMKPENEPKPAPGSSKKNVLKTESEIIQDALEIFGGVVIG